MRLSKFFKAWALTGPPARMSQQRLSVLPANLQLAALGAFAHALKRIDESVVWAVAMAVGGHSAKSAELSI